MDLFEKTEAFLGRTIMKTPLVFAGYLLVFIIVIFTFAGYFPHTARSIYPIITFGFMLYGLIVSILHIITMVKNPTKYAPKFCDKCNQVLPENYVSKEDRDKVLSHDFEEQEDPIYIWMQNNQKLANKYSGQFVAVTTKVHKIPYTLLDHDEDFGRLYHRAPPDKRTDFVIGRLP